MYNPLCVVISLERERLRVVGCCSQRPLLEALVNACVQPSLPSFFRFVSENKESIFGINLQLLSHLRRTGVLFQFAAAGSGNATKSTGEPMHQVGLMLLLLLLLLLLLSLLALLLSLLPLLLSLLPLLLLLLLLQLTWCSS